MKIPRFPSPSAMPDRMVTLPSVSAVVARGCLAESAPVARFGGPKDAVLYLLLSMEQRRHVSEWVGNRSDRMAPDFERFAVLRPNGQRGFWHNAEHLWVAAPWLQLCEPAGDMEGWTWGQRLVSAMVAQASAP